MLTVSPRGPARELIERLSRGKGRSQTPLISIAGLSRAPRGESGPQRISPLGYNHQRDNLLDVSLEGEKGLALFAIADVSEHRAVSWLFLSVSVKLALFATADLFRRITSTWILTSIFVLICFTTCDFLGSVLCFFCAPA